MLFTYKDMKKNYNNNKWYPGQRVMFLDDRSHTSDELLKGMPRRVEICTVRRVLGAISQDTGERCIGLYLVGYHNPCEDGSWECIIGTLAAVDVVIRMDFQLAVAGKL